jgi:hypothetical protein
MYGFLAGIHECGHRRDVKMGNLLPIEVMGIEERAYARKEHEIGLV